METALPMMLFALACLLLITGAPVAFALSGAAFMAATLGGLMGHFDWLLFASLPSRIYGGAMTNQVLVAVPLFVFMGVVLERSFVAEDLLKSMSATMGRLRGGLGIAVCLVGGLLAASTGIVGATVVTMGLISLPTMLKRGYDPGLASGTICASGTLGQIIPPSIVLVLLGDQIGNAYGAAQRAIGNWAPEPFSVSDLFAGALIPGFILVACYVAYQVLIATIKPDHAPKAKPEDISDAPPVLMALLPPLALIIAVLGSIIAGVATPTESASLGAVGAILLAARRLGLGARRAVDFAGLGVLGLIVLVNSLDLRWGRDASSTLDSIGIFLALLCSLALIAGLGKAIIKLHQTRAGNAPDGPTILAASMHSTVRISAMIFTILIGASVFSLVFRGLGGDDMVLDALHNLPGGQATAIITVMLVMFLLGFFLDFIEITFVVVPIAAPALLMMDIDPTWLGIMMALNLQMSFLTPPFGFSLFYLRGVAPASIKTTDIYRGVMPFILIQIAVLALIAYWPALATALPALLK